MRVSKCAHSADSDRHKLFLALELELYSIAKMGSVILIDACSTSYLLTPLSAGAKRVRMFYELLQLPAECEAQQLEDKDILGSS